MEKISFTIHGDPVPKGRARAVIRNGKIGHYTPKKTVDYENLVKQAAILAMKNQKPSKSAFALECTFWLSVPKSHPNKRVEACLRGYELHIKKPDLDNLVKSVKDGMNGIVWVDDCQVISVNAIKTYGVCGKSIINVYEVAPKV